MNSSSDRIQQIIRQDQSTSFSKHSINRIAIRVPHDTPNNKHSKRALLELKQSIQRNFEVSYPTLICPVNQLTRPGDWRYDASPLESFDWSEGCIRIQFVFFEDNGGGLNKEFSESDEFYMTVVVVSTLDCKDSDAFRDMQLEYDEIKRKRIFVFDSFAEESSGIDIDASRVVHPNELIAFPPFMAKNHQVMDMHLNVVVNDLAVAIFVDMEQQIRKNDALLKEPSLIQVSDISNLLITSLDDQEDINRMTAKEKIEFLRKREVARRQKQSADFCLFLGSPFDAYNRYNRACELTMAFSPDPLWYALSLEGCAASLVAMADAGGHGADAFLESSFQCPDEVINVARGIASNPEMKAVFASDKAKTTLPEAIYSLSEDALDVLVRYKSMSVFYSRLLLKLARYVAESEDSHLRCRWGEGKECYKVHVSSGNMRWANTSMALVDALVGSLDEVPSLVSAYNQYSLKRAQNCASFLHRAVSAGGLKPSHRIGMSFIATQICLDGVKITPFGKDRKPSYKVLPRKAAFFMLSAAETLASIESDKELNANIWLTVSKMYPGAINTPDENGYYAWSNLRANILQALIQQQSPSISENALELLVMLLSEMSPGPMKKMSSSNRSNQSSQPSPYISNVNDVKPYPALGTRDTETNTGNENPSHPPKINKDQRVLTPSRKDESKEVEPAENGLVAGRKQYATVLKEIHARQIVRPLDLPQFPVNGENLEVMSFRCSKGYLRFDACYAAQRKFLDDLVMLRKNRPTITQFNYLDYISNDSIRDSSIPPPLELINASVVPLDADMVLERTKAHGVAPKKTGSMATFFNPYSKKSDAMAGQPTLVAEGEERTILVKFNNRLGINLDVPCCELEFSTTIHESIEAPPLSFTIPAKSKNFPVCFPFKVLRIGRDEIADEIDESSINEPFELLGLRVTIFDRCFFLALPELGKDFKLHQSLIPQPASIYQRTLHDKPTRKGQSPVKLEAVPPQPNLLVSFTGAFTPLEDSAIIPVHISDGEIFTIPTFRLENDHGSSGQGKLVQLQILSVGLPGVPDEVIYDSHASIKVEDDLSDTSSDDFEELMEEDGLPPLRMKAFCDELSLEKVNKKDGQGSSVTFQMAAAHDLGRQLEYKKHNIRVRFRYRGLSNDKATLIWRRREIKLNVVRVKGPRISSMTFRPDLSWGSAVYELSKSLSQQIEKSNNLVLSSHGNEVKNQMSTNFSGDEIVVLVAVANECKSTIILSNKAGRVGGFDGSPMPTVRVTSGVSVKIPVLIQRIPLKDENGEDMDVAQELITRTALQWVSEEGDGVDAKGSMRSGRVRIPQRCLKQLINNYPSFLSKICQVPVSVSVNIKDHDVNEVIGINVGDFIEVSMCFKFQEWVPQDLIHNSSLIVEFCCARKEIGGSSQKIPSKILNDDAYFWCGQIRQVIKSDELQSCGKSGIFHKARLTFIQTETFVVSACARLTCRDHTSDVREEIWWAPRAYQVRATKPK